MSLRFAQIQDNLRKGREKHEAMLNRATCGTCGAPVLRCDASSPWVHVGPCKDLPEDHEESNHDRPEV